MASRFQACSLVASPVYPSSIAWSEENLIAVASGHIVTILNPALPYGPRGFVKIPAFKPFPVGVIEKKDLLSRGMLTTCLSRDRERPCVRSVSWSPLGLSSNGGCLLAVCTADGRVKLYRQPFWEKKDEWVEAMDISDMIYDYLEKVNFGESNSTSSNLSEGLTTNLCTELSFADDVPLSVVMKGCKRARDFKASRRGPATHTKRSIVAFTEVASFPCSTLKEGSTVEVLKYKGSQRFWISCVLDKLKGEKAHILLPEADENGRQDEWFAIHSGFGEVGAISEAHTCFPKVRPSTNVGCFPMQLLSPKCSGVREILKVGIAVEAWINDRWIQGSLMGFDKNLLLVNLSGDIGTLTLDACSVRLAPLWMAEQNLWQFPIVKLEMEDPDLPKVVEIKCKKRKEKESPDNVPVPKSKAKPINVVSESGHLPKITADQYASRIATLSSLVVSWSPVLQFLSENAPNGKTTSSNCFSLLAVGGKSGEISFSRISESQCYSVEQSTVPMGVAFAGLLQAHKSWVTVISWALFTVDELHPRVLLVTGSSNGSLKIWIQDNQKLMKLHEDDHSLFDLVKEIIENDSTPVSALSVTVPSKSLYKMHLAVGKGSGSIEVWICELSTRKFDKVGSYDAHRHIVSGLAWAFDGCCLYSCSQDNSLRSWVLSETSLREAPIPSNTFGLNSSRDLPNVSDSCFGVAVSSGNMVLAVARSFDVELLDRMYQARIHKAAVEFFWIGGQKLNSLSNTNPEFDDKDFPGFSEELLYWKSNMLWSIKQYHNLDEPLIVWDIVAALSAFIKTEPTFVEHILMKWLYLTHANSCSEDILSYVSTNLQNISTRQLHLLNIFCRRVVLSDLKAEEVNNKQRDLKGLCDVEHDQVNMWMKLLLKIEGELRKRIVGFSLSTVLSTLSDSGTHVSKFGNWHPGAVQMEKWIALECDHHDQDQLKRISAEVAEIDIRRLETVCDYKREEKCNYCSASVPFESPEVGFCQGLKCSHKLPRCSVSMQICPATPLWFCICCQRHAFQLAPNTIFQFSKCPSDFKSLAKVSTADQSSKPLCPFCGVLQQRLQPAYLLSPSPV